MEKLVYNAGPTARLFHADDTFNRGLRGPIRTGKSVVCSIEGLLKANKQAVCKDGIKHARWLVVRNTYGQLVDTTIKTLLTWIPPATYGTYTQTPYPNYLVKFNDVELEIWFRALDRPDHVRNLLSMEYTYFWVNEARELPKEIIDWLESRAGQFPPKVMMPSDYKGDDWPAWYGGWMDTNSPDVDHWWFELFEELVKNDAKISERYRQFFVSKEENEHNLPKGYYKNLAIGKSKEWIKVYIEGQYGATIQGKLVYTEYSEGLGGHLREENYEPVRGIEIVRGWDLGNTLFPACVFAQMNHGFEVFDELLMPDTGMHKAKEIAQDYCTKWYPDFEFIDYGDPAMLSRLAGDTDIRTTQQIFAAGAVPILMRPGAVSFTERRETIKRYLEKMVPQEKAEGAAPFFRLSPRCKMVRSGLRSNYFYPEIGRNTGKYLDKPEKNMWSHPINALEYVMTGLFSAYEERHPEKKKKAFVRPPSSMAV